MSIESFMKENKVTKENATYKVTNSLCDKNGVPLEWTIKPITTREETTIKAQCLVDTPIKNKENSYISKLDYNKYVKKVICSCIVEPNLNSKELQDSYGVMSSEELLLEMVNNYFEYEKLYNFIKLHSCFSSPKRNTKALEVEK